MTTLTTSLTVAARFRGPPRSGNGGYVAGLLARHAGGHRSVAMRAPVPLDTPLDWDGARLTLDGALIAEAMPADAAALPEPPASPTLDAARAAGERAVCHHSICFCCGNQIGIEEGLRVFTGQLDGAEPGVVAGVWTVHPTHVGDDGVAPVEYVWAAIDCPGSYAWFAKEERPGGLTGSMQAEVLAQPKTGDECIVMAWPIDAPSERRRISGVALFAADGTLMARGVQTWIRLNRPPAGATGSSPPQ